MGLFEHFQYRGENPFLGKRLFLPSHILYFFFPPNRKHFFKVHMTEVSVPVVINEFRAKTEPVKVLGSFPPNATATTVIDNVS
jgi:hypothetical protein